jgi:isochorismate pyruvate lyase
MPTNDNAVSPEKCQNMAEVRDGVDATDRALVALLTRRFAYMDAAARIKTDRQAVRDEDRKAQVLSNIAREAEVAGLDPVRLRAVWEVLIEESISHELMQWDKVRSPDSHHPVR